MTKTLTEKELTDLLNATKEAGRAAGYAQAKQEIAIERLRAGGSMPMAQEGGDEGVSATPKP